VAISRVYYYGLLLRVAIYSLPLVSFFLAAFIRFGPELFPRHTAIVMDNYLIVLLATELTWILAANHYKLSSLTNLFWECTGMRAAIYACFATFLAENVLLVFAKQLVISRLFVVLSIAILFAGTVAVRTFFRTTLSTGRLPRKSERILMVGTDQYARRAVKLLNRVPFLRCSIHAYLQLPGQAVIVNDAPVLSMADPEKIDPRSFDEVVVAIPAERYSQVSSFVDSLQNLGKPIRAILDLGPRLSVQERLFQVGRLQVMSLGVFPVESFAYTVLKRAFDLVVASLSPCK
jgi:FlaA1/EpsC-like NDP-sugar epimerase